MPLGMEVCLGPAYIVLGGNQLPQKRGTAPNYCGPHVYCGQTAGWIKMPLGMETGLGPGDIMLDGDQAPPFFGPCLLLSLIHI